MYPTDRHQTFGVWSVQHDRDLSRAAAERHFLLQAVTEQRQSGSSPSRLRRLLIPSLRTRGAEA